MSEGREKVSWGGWEYDPWRGRLSWQPEDGPRKDVSLKEGEGRLFCQLILAEGRAVGTVALGNASLVSGSRSMNPKGLCALRVSKLRGLLGKFAIITSHGVGFRLCEVSKMGLEKEQHAQVSALRRTEAVRKKPVAMDPEASRRKSEAKRATLVDLFKYEFEATGPHARAVAASVMRIFGE